MNIENNFEGTDNMPTPETPEMSQEEKEDSFPVPEEGSKKWAKEGEVKIEKYKEGGDKSCVEKYTKDLDKVGEEVLRTFK